MTARSSTRLWALPALLLTVSPSLHAQGVDPDPVSESVRQLLTEQTAAWNAGKLAEFMQYYLPSDELTFSAGGQTTRGWQATLDRYRQRYPDREAMGHLSFSDLEVHPLGSDACFVLGRWSLRRPTDQPAGNFTLILRKVNHRWLIVHDHTSALEEPR